MTPQVPGRERPADELTVAPDGRPLADQPRWRQDFPIDVVQDEYVARREFVKFLVLTSSAFVAGQIWILGRGLLRRPPSLPELEIARLDELAVGGAVGFDYPVAGKPKLLVRLGESEFVAYEGRCTHLSCPVIPQPEKGRFYCPCHSGSFDIATGKPIAGPPRRPLQRVELAVRDGRVFATGLVEATL
ncbi:MAG: Rieske (2Fe-2S) protein [Thermoanaerobaculia bacterium]